MTTRTRAFGSVALFASLPWYGVAAAGQPPVAPGVNEPDWPVLLRQVWGLDLHRDLRNPLTDGASPAALFQRADARLPVTFKPVAAFGQETTTRAGWYPAGPLAGDVPADLITLRRPLWACAYKNPRSEHGATRLTPPPLTAGSTDFDPGDRAFGLWVANDTFDDGGVYTQPAAVARYNARLKAQPCKAMIYPNVDRQTQKPVPNSYLIGWEYSTNDDFQDMITRIDNVTLLPSDPPLPGIVAPETRPERLATGFKFVEGPAWNTGRQALYFSDIPAQQILRYAGGQVTVARENSRMANGLMFDRRGLLVACEHGGRRLSRGEPTQPGTDVATRYAGKRLNSPNDLWIDAADGIYFTDPRYGQRDDLEQDAEAVYYVEPDGAVRRVIGDLVRPNGIALSPGGKTLYVVDNNTNTLHCYPVTGPGRIGPGRRIAFVDHPDGMTVDVRGRLYIACRPGISVLEADGRWVGTLPLPEAPANCTFGGPVGRTLFVTARTSLYSVETLTRGWHVHLDGPPPPGPATTRSVP